MCMYSYSWCTRTVGSYTRVTVAAVRLSVGRTSVHMPAEWFRATLTPFVVYLQRSRGTVPRTQPVPR